MALCNVIPPHLATAGDSITATNDDEVRQVSFFPFLHYSVLSKFIFTSSLMMLLRMLKVYLLHHQHPQHLK